MKISIRLARAVVYGYRVARGPHLPSCRFIPSCSEYALEALQAHGLFRGSLLVVKRLSKCHPWGSWGVDPVPTKNR